MSGRYAAFTFVDRITELVPGVSARGTFHIPAGIEGFPSSLLAEATGQLAAWVAVAKLAFRLRPVAGIAHETVYRGVPRPGDTLDTEIRIDSCEDDAVAYQGWARIGGNIVLELHDCVGPMLPLADFDDADAMRRFFATLCTDGAQPDRFPGIEPVTIVPGASEHARLATAQLDVPGEAAFFDDHFPRRPVFPGTLLLDRMTSLAIGPAEEAAAASLRLSRVTDVKLRTFIEPGARLDLRANVDEVSSESVTAMLQAWAAGQRRPVGGARVHFEVQR